MNPIPFIINPSGMMSSDLPPYSASTGVEAGGHPHPHPHPHTPSSPGLHLHPAAQATHNRLAGSIQTCSIADMKHDYFRISLDPSSPSTSSSYLLSLTTHPSTPLYRISLPQDPAALGSIIIYPFSSIPSPATAVAAARFTKNPKRYEPIASVCTSEPYKNASAAGDLPSLSSSNAEVADDESTISISTNNTNTNPNPNSNPPNTTWRPLYPSSRTRTGKIITLTYRCQIPIVLVPGLHPSIRAFIWRTTPAATYFELASEGGLEIEPGRTFENVNKKGDGKKDGKDWSWRRVLARVTIDDEGKPDVFEIRRGGGVEFEMAVLVHVWAILEGLKRG